MDEAESNMLLIDQQSQQYGGYLNDVEIVGDTKHVNRIRKLFENSSVKIKVVQDRAPLKETLMRDDATKDTCTEPYNDVGEVEVPTPLRAGLCGSSDDNSSGLDSEDESRSPTPDSSRNSPGSTPKVSPEVRNRRNMILVQSRIKNLGDKTLITPTRIYLKEATFIKHKHHYIFYLFDDLLVITKAKENQEKAKPGALRQVKFCKALDLRYLTVEAIPDSTSKGCHLLKFHYAKSRRKKWKRIFSCQTREQKDTWFADLRKLRDQLTLGPNFAALFKNVF
jgi:hypothetical protein